MSIPLPQPQHKDLNECFNSLKKVDEETILTLAAACDHDNSLLLKLRSHFDSIPEYPPEEGLRIKANAEIRRNGRRDGFATGKLVSIVYSQQQRIVLQQVFDKLEQIQQYRHAQTLRAQQAAAAQAQAQAAAAAALAAAAAAASTTMSDLASPSGTVDPSRPTPPTAPNAPQFRLFVGGIDPATSDHEFRQFFAQFPTLKHTNMPLNPNDKTKRRGYGFVEFLTYYGLDSCLAYHQRTKIQFHGKPVDIQIPKDNVGLLQEWQGLQLKYEHDLIEYNQQYNPGAVVISTITGAPLCAAPSPAAVPSMNDIGDANATTTTAISTAMITQLQDIPEHKLPRSDAAGAVLCIANMFSQADKDDIDSGDISEADLKEEVMPQFQAFGDIQSSLLRFTTGVQAHDEQNQQFTYYPIFVQFTSNQVAAAALAAMGGLTFDGRQLYAYLTSDIPQ